MRRSSTVGEGLPEARRGRRDGKTWGGHACRRLPAVVRPRRGRARLRRRAASNQMGVGQAASSVGGPRGSRRSIASCSQSRRKLVLAKRAQPARRPHQVRHSAHHVPDRRPQTVPACAFRQRRELHRPQQRLGDPAERAKRLVRPAAAARRAVQVQVGERRLEGVLQPARQGRPLPAAAPPHQVLHGSTPPAMGELPVLPYASAVGMLPRLKACMEVRPQRWGNCRYFLTRQRSGCFPG